MKPPFALSLSEDGLTLLFRVAEGWAPLGHVGFDAPDLESRLADLRGRAETLAPGGVATKLVLPDTQILYTEVSAPGPDAASRRAQIATALEGRTPYAVVDLAYDWSRQNGGAKVLVAVVARVTLAEAESFAEAQGFNPVAFVAAPSPRRFAGEPFFGPCSRAAIHLPDGARLDRDQDPVRIVALPPEIAAIIAPGAAETAGPEALEAGTASPAVAEAGATEAAATEAAARSQDEAHEVGESGGIEPEPTDAAPASPSDLPETIIDAEKLEATDPAPAPPTGEPDAAPVPEAPFIAIEDLAEDFDAGTATRTADATELPDGTVLSPAFASRRQTTGGAAETHGAPPGDPASLLAEATSRLHLLADAPETVTVPRGVPRIGPAAATLAITAPAIDLPQTVADARDGAGGNGLRRKGSGRTPLTALPETRHGTQAQLRERQAAASSLAPSEATGAFGAPPAAPRRTVPDRRRLGLILTAALVLLMLAVALWSLWFGAAPTSPDPAAPAETSAAPAVPAEPAETASTPAPQTAQRTAQQTAPPPRPATAATAGIDGATDPAGDAVTAALTEALAGDEAVAASTPAPNTPEVAAPGIDPAPSDTALGDAPDATTPAMPAPAPQATTEGAATATEAAPVAAPGQAPAPVWTGIPSSAATGADDQNSGATALAALADPGREALPATPEGLAETAPATTADALPEAQPLPPPFGTVITFGPDGRIVPTPEGVVTPDGFTLYAGRPPLVPAAAPRPGAAAAPSGSAAGSPATEPTLPPLPAPVDPAHSARNPQLRPAAVLERAAAARALAPVTPAAPAPAESAAPVPPEAAPAATEGALPPLPGPVDPAHAALGPKLRPAAVTARAETARAQATAIAAAAEAAARAEAEALASASRYAVASSRRPTDRASALAKAVEAAVAAAVTAAVTTPEPAPAAAPSPAPEPAPEAVEIDEPEPLEAVPNMPTTVTVARQATVKNAIDLGKINLIGVYGSSANRRALVRMPSGRLLKVKIGDRLDGGQVAAIGDSELTYVKGGRSFTLKIQKNG